jgi:hypothetical protein
MTQPQPLRAVSYGGGVQSTSLLVLAATGRIDFPLFLMANVGDDSEDPRTLDYVRDVAAPYAADHGIELAVLDRVKRDGTVETLMGRLMREDSRSLPIPIRMSNGAPGTRSCTSDFKIKVIARELKRRGASKDNPATIGIGISLDEIHRANARKVSPWERVVYPLVGIGEETGLHMRRDDCARVIREGGLPVPPKSACFFCPFHKASTWSDLARERPDLFDRAADLEETLNRRRAKLAKDPVWLTRFNMPLRQAIDTDQPLLPLLDEEDGSCGSGWCAT